MLKNREHPFPPQGFIFYQPQTAWWSSPGFTFWQTVDEIIAMRKKNPRFASQWSLDRNDVANELDAFTCLRINQDPNYCEGATEAQKKTSFGGVESQRHSLSLLQALRESAAAAGDRVENAGAGIGLVIEWLGHGLNPVAQGLADRRASICAACPENGRPDFLQRLEGWIGSGVKDLLTLKNDLALQTPLDAALHHCQVCDCALKLKVWTPLEEVLAHTRAELMPRFPELCWIKRQDK